MIICRYGNCDYTEFETIRDEIFANGNYAMGLIAANYSPNLRIAIFSFISADYAPPSLKKAVKHFYWQGSCYPLNVEQHPPHEHLKEEKIDTTSYPPES